jgi:hypothetical protein
MGVVIASHNHPTLIFVSEADPYECKTYWGRLLAHPQIFDVAEKAFQ